MAPSRSSPAYNVTAAAEDGETRPSAPAARRFPRWPGRAMLAAHKRPFTPPLRRAFRDEHRSRPPGFRRLRAGRPLPARQRPRLSHRHPGAGAPADDAAPARPARRPQHRRLHLRLSRLAARHVSTNALWTAKNTSKRNNIHFQPGLNEDLAATAVWGTQQTNLFPGANVDGVFAIWYGKGPGVDRSVDVLKHGNAAGTSPHGGVLVLAGDDHGCQVLDPAAPERAHLRRGDDPGAEPGERAGISRLRPAGLRDVAATRAAGSA